MDKEDKKPDPVVMDPHLKGRVLKGLCEAEKHLRDILNELVVCTGENEEETARIRRSIDLVVDVQRFRALIEKDKSDKDYY
mgnify:FL=1